MSRLFLVILVVTAVSCATEDPGGGIDIDGKADTWGTGDTPCDACLREYYGCVMYPGEDGPMSSTCGQMLNFCMEDEGLSECEGAEEPAYACGECQQGYDECIEFGSTIDVICQTEFTGCATDSNVNMWCIANITCDECMGGYASCMSSGALDSSACLSAFGSCVEAGGMNDGSCAPVWEPGPDACDDCMYSFNMCLQEGEQRSVCTDEFNVCLPADMVDSCPLPDPCGVCIQDLEYCITEGMDSCRSFFDECVVDNEAAGCAITCEVCQDITTNCMTTYNDDNLCFNEIFADCFNAGGLSSDTCSPPYD